MKTIKNKLLLVFIFLIPSIGFSDTLDFWSVYLNDSLLANFNSSSDNNKIVLQSNDIKKADSITIIYGNDHPCGKCEYYYGVKELTSHVKVKAERRHKISSKVSFSLMDLKLFRNAKEFEFFLYEISYTSGSPDSYTFLFLLQIE